MLPNKLGADQECLVGPYSKEEENKYYSDRLVERKRYIRHINPFLAESSTGMRKLIAKFDEYIRYVGFCNLLLRPFGQTLV
jgi:hypothetical protein